MESSAARSLEVKRHPLRPSFVPTYFPPALSDGARRGHCRNARVAEGVPQTGGTSPPPRSLRPSASCEQNLIRLEPRGLCRPWTVQYRRSLLSSRARERQLQHCSAQEATS